MVSIIQQKLHEPQFDNNSHVKLIFYRFVYNRHKCHLFVLFEHRYSIEKIWGYATILCATTCDYVLFTTTFTTIYQLHQIWGGFATILQLMCNYYLLHPPM